MGDITGRPKAPPQQVVYVPQYIASPATSVSASTTSSTASGGSITNIDAPKTENEFAKEREKSLLGRSRSRVGTIFTSFRGLLAPIDNADSRKTLLGE